MLADRIWEIRKQGHITEQDIATFPNLRITQGLLNCVEFELHIHIDHGYAKQIISDGMEEYFAEYMVDSSLKNNDNPRNLIATLPTYERIINKYSSNIPPVSNLPYTATPLAEPRRISTVIQTYSGQSRN